MVVVQLKDLRPSPPKGASGDGAREKMKETMRFHFLRHQLSKKSAVFIVLLSLALAGSLVINLRAWRSGSDEARASLDSNVDPPRPAQTGDKEPPPGTAPESVRRCSPTPTDTRSATEACRAELEACRERLRDAAHVRWDGSQVRTRTDESQMGAPSLVSDEVDDDLRIAVLDEHARRQLRERWSGQRDEILTSLGRSLGDRQKQQEDALREADRFATILALDEADRETLRRGYTKARLARIEAIHELTLQRPVDFEAVMEEARALFRDEDTLVLRLFGPDGERKLRMAQLEGRTIILALIAALGDLSWDDGLAW
jgi:hypothetical protein